MGEMRHGPGAGCARGERARRRLAGRQQHAAAHVRGARLVQFALVAAGAPAPLVRAGGARARPLSPASCCCCCRRPEQATVTLRPAACRPTRRSPRRTPSGASACCRLRWRRWRRRCGARRTRWAPRRTATLATLRSRRAPVSVRPEGPEGALCALRARAAARRALGPQAPGTDAAAGGAPSAMSSCMLPQTGRRAACQAAG